jgi:hypothetical protein
MPTFADLICKWVDLAWYVQGRLIRLCFPYLVDQAYPPPEPRQGRGDRP